MVRIAFCCIYYVWLESAKHVGAHALRRVNILYFELVQTLKNGVWMLIKVFQWLQAVQQTEDNLTGWILLNGFFDDLLGQCVVERDG